MSMQASPDVNEKMQDRRRKPRMACIFPVVVRSHENRSARLAAQATLTNISASGMYLHTQQHIPNGSLIFLFTCFSQTTPWKSQAPRLAATAEVVRVEPKPDGGYGVAIRLQRYRFL